MSYFLYWEFEEMTHFTGFQRARRSRCEGRKPYGFYPGEKRVVERMRALRATGTAYDKLAAQLTSEGFRTRKGAAWHGFSVQHVLARYVVVDVTFHTNPSSSSLRRRSRDMVAFFVRCTPTHCPSR
jgi:hypothetical protein